MQDSISVGNRQLIWLGTRYDRRVGCRDGIELAPSSSSSIKPSVLCTPVFVLLGGRGGPLAAAESCWLCGEGLNEICVVRCEAGGNPALGSLDGARRTTGGRVADTVLSVAGLLLSWLARRPLDSLSNAGFFGTGGTGLRDDAETVDARLEALDLGSFVGACTFVKSREYFGGIG